MNRTLTAAVALAAGFGLAGLAQAQTYQRPMNTQPATQMNGTEQAAASPADIQQAQQELKSQGLYNGAIDGVMGPETRTALSRFQQQNGLTPNAALDQETKDKLSQANNAGTGTGTLQPQPTPNPAAAPAPPPSGMQQQVPSGTNNR